MAPVTLMHEFLARSADRFPRKIALVSRQGEYTYEQLLRNARGFAAYLTSQGFEESSRVVIYLGNCYEAVVSLFGTMMAGGVFSVVAPSTKPIKLRSILDNCDPTCVVTDQSGLSTLRALDSGPTVPTIITSGTTAQDTVAFDAVVDAAETPHPPALIDLDLAAIIYTSGSTGEPKGVTLTHRNMVTAAHSITTYLENVESDIVLSVLPMSFDYGLYQVLMAFLFGGTIVLKDSFGFPYQLIEEIRDRNITGLPCVPTMFAILLRSVKESRPELSSVRYITNTGAALPPAYIPRLQKLFPNARIFSMYGLTECKRVSYLPPHLIYEKPESVGIPMPNLEVFVVDDDGRLWHRDAIGELVVRSSTVMQGYFNNPKATDDVLKQGKYPWEKVLYTGDLFRIDEEGFLYFLGRKDDVFKSRGERISPKEIENILYEIEDVVAARVSAVPDEIMGNAIKAEVALADSSLLTVDDIMRHCRQNLEELFVPKHIHVVPSLPQSVSGKVKRS